MKGKTSRGFIGVLVVSAMGMPSASASPSAALERLREVVAEVVDRAPGEIGVAIKHLESGQQVEVRGHQAYPMASTFKLPILVELFNQVDEGKIRLDEMVSLDVADLHLGSGQLKHYLVPGVSLSLENLALLMMRISDNSATDILLDRVGVDNVNRRLAALGIEGISVNRSCQRLILNHLGLSEEVAQGKTYEEVVNWLDDYEPEPGELEKAAARFEDDPRDIATPLAMNRLLEKILQHQAAKPESCRKMIDIMLQCDTGKNRIRGFLSRDVEVAHKTGTIGGTVNNVGVIFLPAGRGRIVVSVLSKKMTDRDGAERAIADVARYAYDYFLFTAPENAGGAR
ncbi:MAG: serine hydrolase [Acidobacteriota bacterium]